jgi:hypothetical protein
MDNITADKPKRTARQQFAELGRQLKKGILTLPTEGKVPLKWKPMWVFMCQEFADLDIHFISIVLPFACLMVVTLLSALLVPFAIANDNILPSSLLGTLVIIGFIILVFYTIGLLGMADHEKGKLWMWLKNKKQTTPYVIRILSGSTVILFCIIAITFSIINPVGQILLPLALGAIIIWILTEIMHVNNNLLVRKKETSDKIT